MDENTFWFRTWTMVALAFVLVVLFTGSCVQTTNKQCEETRRQALSASSAAEPARSLVLAKGCAAG